MDDQEKESSLKPISEGVQEILEDQTAELKALGIYASFQPVNLGKGGEDNVNQMLPLKLPGQGNKAVDSQLLPMKFANWPNSPRLLPAKLPY